MSDHLPGLSEKLRSLLNGYENDSNTPDFILAEYLISCLDAYNAAVRRRALWYGRIDEPGMGSIPYTNKSVAWNKDWND